LNHQPTNILPNPNITSGIDIFAGASGIAWCSSVFLFTIFGNIEYDDTGAFGSVINVKYINLNE
jgi:hypothetical protein